MSGYDISSRISVIDMMTPVLGNIVTGMESVINNMEMMSASSKGMIDTASLQSGRQAIENLKETLSSVENTTQQNTDAQKQHNNAIRNGAGPADAMLGKMKAIAATYFSMQGVKMAIGLSDEMALTKARINELTGDLEKTKVIQNEIYNSAMRARAAYGMTGDIVSKLGMQAGHAFSGLEETISFAEQLQKRFKIAGTDAQGVESVMYNLTQAMSVGVLRGQDLNSVLANAPGIAQDTAKYMGYTVDQVKKLAEEGKLTAQVVKEAMLATADETNAKFANIPMTFADMWTTGINLIQHALEPVMGRLNEIINTESFQQGATGVVEAVAWIAEQLVELLADVMEVAAAISDNWSNLEPTILGVAAAVGAWAVATGIMAVQQGLLNSTLLKNPIYAVIAVVVAIIVAIVRWVQAVGGLQVALERFQNRFWIIVNSVQIAFATMRMNVMKGMNSMEVGIARVTMSIKNWFTDMKVNVIKLAQDMVNGVIDAINFLINAVNKIPLVSIETIEKVSWAADAGIEAEATKQARQAEFDALESGNKAQIAEMQKNITDMQIEASANRLNRENEIAKMQAEIAKDKTENIPNNVSDVSKYQSDLTAGMGTGAGAGAIGDTAKNTGKMAQDTAKIAENLDRTNEELTYLKDAVTSRSIDKYTSDKIDIHISNEFGDVKSDVDLDGFMGKIVEDLRDTVEYGIGGAIRV